MVNRVISYIMICSLFFFINCGGDKMKNENKLLHAIGELHEKDKKASLAGDTEILLSLFTDDGILIPSDGEIVQGKKGLREMLEKNQEILKEYNLVEYNQDFKEIKIIGKYAYEWGYYNGKYISKTDNSEVVGSGKLMRILELQDDGDWKVSRSIWSVDKE